ncbi:pullulanase [Peribacillus muralis]|uniref:DUF6509 family protein n=1 Tax=Peribacillus muralis TaxID=264697 RepID=UPI001F4EAD36|nr:DUF6509 family protein [Peribacillus muralis]MCK1992419.1 DUF6509 family protein [Peribacillus muralis]MCK2012975.1 DUF6509 family protein [Peribacillus muralis]
MLNITEYSFEKLNDPFGILSGERYELFLDIEVAEDDELFSENGLYVRVLFVVEEQVGKLIKYDIFEKGTEGALDFELEEDEEAMITDFCLTHLDEAMNN